MFTAAGNWIDGRFVAFRDWLDRKLVPTWRIWWKLWSMRLGAISAALLTYLTAVPNAFSQAIAMFPPWLKDSLPVWVGPLLLAVLFFTRFWDQGPKIAPAQSDDDDSPQTIQVKRHGAE